MTCHRKDHRNRNKHSKFKTLLTKSKEDKLKRKIKSKKFCEHILIAHKPGTYERKDNYIVSI